MSKILLINFAGHTLNSNTFIPDSSMAILASILEQYDIPVEIDDYQNPSDIGKVNHNPVTDLIFAKKIKQSLMEGREVDDETIIRYQEEREKGEEYLLNQAFQSIDKKIREENISIIGFKLWVGKTLQRLFQLAKKIKEHHPKVELVAGGPALLYLKEAFYQKTNLFDKIATGDGEDFLLKLVGEKLKKSLPLCQGNLRHLPIPSYRKHLYPKINQFFKMRMIDDSRGCFNHCAFCSHSFLSGSKVRMRSVKQVVDEMEYAFDEDGIRHFRFTGSNPPWRFVKKIAEEILLRKLDINYSIFSSFNNAKAQDFTFLQKSGLKSIFFGVESANQHILTQYHHKNNISWQHMIDISREAMKSGIFIALSLIYPSPFETAESKKQNLDLMAQIFRDQNHGSLLILPSFLGPGSKWWNNMKDFGLQFEDGQTKENYLLTMVDSYYDVLLPKKAIQGLKYSLNGKPVMEIFKESSQFNLEIQKMGIVTDFDDSAFMLAHLGKTTPKKFQEQMISGLLEGNEQELLKLVQAYNNA